MNWAKWKGGIFNGGQFTSGLGWTQSGLRFNNSNEKVDYSWEGGQFNGGEFGNGLKNKPNSTWYDGEFNGGSFKGRLWNNGIFSSGDFEGSGNLDKSGENDINRILENITDTYSQKYINSFKTDFYGIWASGSVIEKDEINNKSINFKNILWYNGNFNHKNAIMSDSVWLNGSFVNGTFVNSCFNPYSQRSESNDYSFSTSSCVWINGNLYNSDFYMSEWLNGNFYSGYSYGMWFKNGISYYMNAYNSVFGGVGYDPTWIDGVWNGSYFDYDGTINSPFISTSIDLNKIRTNSDNIHIWNIFKNENNDYNTINIIADKPITKYNLYTPVQIYGDELYIPTPIIV